MVFLNNQLILYGGFTDDGMADDRFFIYSVDSKVWMALALKGIPIGQRACHSMSFFTPNTLFIFGGQIKNNKEGQEYISANDLFLVEIDTWNSSTPFLANIGPSNRFGHGSSHNANFDDNEHLIVGGLDKTYCAFDVFMIKEISDKLKSAYRGEEVGV